MLTINTNISSLVAQGSLKTSTNRLNQAIEQMTTGYKINHAADNAANYSISTNMNTTITAYMVAEDNAATGVDLISTAEGILDQIQDKLERLRALQEQASNGTYGEDSLNAINKEVNAIVDEIVRLYNTAEFNGIKLFGNALEDSPGAGRPIVTTPEYYGNFYEKIARTDTSSMAALSTVSASDTITSGSYKITSASELKQLADMANNGLIQGGEFVLSDNIDLSGYSSWSGIGNVSDDSKAFRGTFNGNGFVVSGVRGNVGLFGNLSGAVIKNVGVENAVITGGNDSAGLTAKVSNGSTSTKIENCYAGGRVTASNSAGGLVGKVDNAKVEIVNSYSEASVSVNGASGGSTKAAGGLVGLTSSGSCNIDKCYSTGNVTCANQYAGGLIGYDVLYSGDAYMGTTSIKNSFSVGTVTGSEAGALAGSIEGYDGCISGCYYNSENNSGLDAVYVSYVSGLTADLTGMQGKTNAELLSMIPDYANRSGGSSGDADGFMNDGVIVFQVGVDSKESSRISVDTSFVLENLRNLRSIGIGNGDYLTQVDTMLASVYEKQTEFGAVANRLESVLEEISIHYDNLVSSRSTFRDADIAEVSSTYIQQQILQQASATLMATANQSPTIALQLL